MAKTVLCITLIGHLTLTSISKDHLTDISLNMVVVFDVDCLILLIDWKLSFVTVIFNYVKSVLQSNTFFLYAYCLFMKAVPCLNDRFVCIEGPLFVFLLDFLSAYFEFLQRLHSGTQSNA